MFPDDVRVETWVERGTEVTPYYDPLLAKMIAHGRHARGGASQRLLGALGRDALAGIETNREYLRRRWPRRRSRAARSARACWISVVATRRQAIEVLDARHADDRAGSTRAASATGTSACRRRARWTRCRSASPTAWSATRRTPPALECTLTGPTLRFHSAAVIALTGADMGATLDGAPVARFRAVAGCGRRRRSSSGPLRGAGSRAYLAVRGGFDVPVYLGSRATFTLGRFGGHGGRALRAGDVLHIGRAAPRSRRRR